MNAVLQENMEQIRDACVKHGVRRLAVFGSAIRDDFDGGSSDADFLVEFKAMSPVRYADSYFGLMEDLESILGAAVDLVEPGPIRNPYFRQAIDATQTVIYDAA